MSINKQKNKTFTKSYPKQFIFKNSNLWNFPNYNQFPKLVKVSGKSEIVGYKFNFFFLFVGGGGGGGGGGGFGRELPNRVWGWSR